MNQGIYMILNTINNKCYIGSSNNISRRKYEHFKDLERNRHYNSYLQASYNKYGVDKFTFIILERIKDTAELCKKECSWISLKNSMDKNHGYNLGIPERNNNLTLQESTLKKVRINMYNKWYKDNPAMTLDDFLAGKRSKDLIERPGRGEKVVYAFNKDTGEKVHEYSSIGETARQLNTNYGLLSKILNNTNRTHKGLVLITKDNYNHEITYIKTKRIGNNKPKTNTPKKPYIRKGSYKGKPIETYNLETKQTIKQYNNKYELAEEFNTSVKYINKIFEGRKKSFRKMGIRYQNTSIPI